MKKTFAIAGIFAAAALLGSAAAVAQGKSATQGANPPMFKAVNETAEEGVKRIENEEGLKSLARADKAAAKMHGFKGFKGRAVGHSRGAKSLAFCPPGQKKKPGSGSRFQC